MTPLTADYLIESLDLKKHPEGGFFRETYNSSPQSGPSSTSIYYLLCGEQKSHLHRLHADEIWHFYAGERLFLYSIQKDGSLSTYKLGPSVVEGDSFQICMPANQWFCAELEQPASYALVGCTMSPGFRYEDFELAPRKELLAEFPQHAQFIRRFTKMSA